MSKNKDKNPNEYYSDTDTQDARMHRLVSLRLRNAMLTHAYYTKGSQSDGDYGLFDIVDPSEEADYLISELRFFGFIPPAPGKEPDNG